jgi:Protein of unknown function (DUF2569).
MLCVTDGWGNHVKMKVGDHIRVIAQQLHRRSIRLIAAAERSIGLIAALWAAALTAILAIRFAQLPADPSWSSLVIHLMLVLSPAAGITLAARAFPRRRLFALPEIALARIGRWKSLDLVAAHSHPSFGATGLMTGLAIGLLLNILMRTGEFLMVMPVMAQTGPSWAQALFFAMAADCIIFNLLYAMTFIMAVRHVPWFPRVLLLVWTADVAVQLLIAQFMGAQPLPAQVVPPLVALLTGNIQKTLISIALWVPYLLLSERVNVTYRRRVRAAALS